ncbi:RIBONUCLEASE [Salix viminalis]|uniref:RIBONUCLEASE n=1 Tax=Salix viminalis TaxID=40686 RepID=A0A9Q0SIP8_SALVM|nr:RIBONUCLEASE [Salix viminalis]
MTAISVATSHTKKFMKLTISIFCTRFNSSKCKTAAKMAVARIKLLRNKREAVMRQMRRDIALLLRSGQDATARIRVEHVIREQNVFAANEFIELFCELVVSRLSIIAKRRECPADLKEGIASLIFAWSKCVPETHKTFNKKTRGGRIQKLVREVYLRDDIYCGALFCKSCEDKSKARSTILVLDTNVVLNQIDLLENPAIEDVTMESPNDRNDRAIRVAARWYQSHLGEAVKVLLITNDRENNRKATEEGVSAETIESYVKSLGHPALLDLLVQPASEDVTMEEVEDMRPSKRKVVYPEHKPMSEITSGLTKVIYHQGKLRVNRYNPFEAYVGSESIGDEIIIYGRGNMNRAFDGDVVAVELLPQDQWNEEKSLSIVDEGQAGNSECEILDRILLSFSLLPLSHMAISVCRLVDPLTKDLRNMNALEKIMRQRRIQRGALTLASAEVKFQIDTETHDPLDIGMYQIREANQMVEEFMLAANVSVAEKEFPECSLLR